MSKLDDIRKQYPGAYDDMSDAELANALYAKSYSDMDRAEFDTLIGTGIPEGDYGPRGLGDNFARAGQSLDDSMRTIVDTVSRGYVDKWLGPEEQAKTAAARERLGWGAAPLDVGAAVATSPYRIGSMGAGAVAGGIEGAASAYGHQEGWVPEVGNILQGAGVGAVAGAGGAKLGEWGGKLWNRFSPEAPPPMPPSTGPAPVPQLGRVGSAVQSFGNLPRSTTVPIDAVLSMLHMPPVVTGASTVAEQASKLFTPRLPPGARPPESATAAAARDALAKMMIGYGRSP